MCVHFCIGFTDFMLNGKSLRDFTNQCLPNSFKDNDRVLS